MSTDALTWDSPIANDGPSFELLPAGKYRFEVTKMERATSSGAKTAGAPMARLEIRLMDPESGKIGSAHHTLVLHKKTEGMLCEFFRSIGQRKHGEAMKPNWGKVVGSSGECEVEIEEYTKRDGGTGQSNRVRKFLDVPGSSQPSPF